MTENGTLAARRPPLSIGATHRWSLIRRLFKMTSDVNSVVEVGCGQGALSYRLAVGREYRGYEPDDASFDIARSRLASLPRADVRHELLPNEPDRLFDALVAFEVLEHLEDDVESLRQWSEWVRPGGLVVVSVPANPDRFGPWDAAVGHLRRYSRSSLEETFDSAGLSPVQLWATGMPLGYITEIVRNLVAPTPSGDQAEDTLASGRQLQPSGALWRVVEASAQPFAHLQRLFINTNLGTGLIAFCQKR